MDLKIININTSYVVWQLINLDENYPADDRRVQLEIYKTVPKTEEETEGKVLIKSLENNDILPIESNNLEKLEPNINCSKEFVTHFDAPLQLGTKCELQATVYYSYGEMANDGSEIALYTSIDEKKLISKKNSNYPRYQVGNLTLDDNNKLTTISPPSQDLIKLYKIKLKNLMNIYNQSQQTEKDYQLLANAIIRLGYILEPSDFYLYYPFITAYDLVFGKVDIDSWNFTNKHDQMLCVKASSGNIIINSTETDDLHSQGNTFNGGTVAIPEYAQNWLSPETNVVINRQNSSQYRALFPPILEAYQPSFVGTENSEYRIYFRLPEYVNFAEVAHVDFRIVLQTNNTSVVNSSFWSDQIIYKVKNRKNGQGDITEHGNGLYSVKIKTDVLNSGGTYDLIQGHWQANTYYKVQARLGTSWAGWNNVNEYVSWRNAQASQGNFSDWSTIMILKSINKPEVSILNNKTLRTSLDIEDTIIELTSSPEFYGQYKQQLNNDNEFLDTYQFILYDKVTGEELENSGIIQYNNYDQSDNESLVIHRFQKELMNDKEYEVKFIATSENGYTDFDTYTFKINISLLSDNIFTENNFSLDIISPFGNSQNQELIEIEDEDGIISLQLKPKDLELMGANLIGNYIITRCKKRENPEEEIWEDLKYVKYVNEEVINFDANIITYKDFTPESGVIYKYGIQKINAIGFRSQRIKSSPVKVNYEHMFLYANNQQLKLKYNPSINSFKHNVMANKQNTLGSRFPYITRNGYTYYAEFPFEALISFNADENEYFLKSEDVDIYRGLSTNLTYDNIYYEKQFREEVEKFLNDGRNKLFRSATEGNFIVNLMNITFTPKKELGRMIYQVQGTAYEMAECTISNLKNNNIITLGKWEPILTTHVIHGQLSGLYKNKENLIAEMIKDSKRLYEKNTELEYNLSEITELSLIPYPKIGLENEIAKAYLNLFNNNQFETMKSYDELVELSGALNTYNDYTPIYLNINNKQIIALPDTPYQLTDQTFQISDNIHVEPYNTNLNYYPPILLEYWGKAELHETLNNVIESSYSKKGYNQLDGYFLTKDTNPYFAFNSTGANIKKESNGHSYFNDLDIVSVIKEQIRLQILEDEGLEVEQIQWQENKTEALLKLKDKNTIIHLNTVPKIIIQTQENRKLQLIHANETVEYNTGPAGLVLENIWHNDKIKLIAPGLSELEETMIKATVTYDYNLIFITYAELNEKEGDKTDE